MANENRSDMDALDEAKQRTRLGLIDEGIAIAKGQVIDGRDWRARVDRYMAEHEGKPDADEEYTGGNTEMSNPAHPGEVLWDVLEGLSMTVTQFAKHIGVSRVTLSRIVNAKAAVTAEMALRISAALGDRPGLWMDIQTQHDLWQVSRNAH